MIRYEAFKEGRTRHFEISLAVSAADDATAVFSTEITKLSSATFRPFNSLER